ncbi:magnesium transporter [Hydrogenovibrio sp. SC-1]|uniref:magnesium transporter n=1 Tax=Hydrogenovibrio sp. SC-1 TaxID=2065820 RepID=UPI000C7E7679|nr:magnesium transporter [Hydrogenovibrio sp. SC-1]PLA74319.1 magnesium transporter [Hydrogenovibrio sp. SC-1]
MDGIQTSKIEEMNAEQRLAFLQKLVADQNQADIMGFFASLTSFEIANLIESFPYDSRPILWVSVADSVKGEVLSALSESARAYLVKDLNATEICEVTHHLDAQDTADILASLQDSRGEDVIELMALARRDEVNEVLAYDPDAVGRYMHTDVVRIRENVKLEVVQRYLRIKGEIQKSTQQLMVVDEKNYLLGSLHVVDLLRHEPSLMVTDVMEAPEKVLATMAAIEAAKWLRLKNQNFAAVVDDSGVLVGQLTAADVLALTVEEGDQTVRHLAGVEEETDLFAPVRKSVNARTIWLGINLATAFLAAAVIGQFEAVIAQVVALAVLMPVVASMGGIAGSQTLTLTIRGLAMEKIIGSNQKVLFNKEFVIGLINGVIWALVVAMISQIWFDDVMISLVIGMAILINMSAAGIAGVLIPLFLKRLGQDPALSGAVILTTVTDVVGFLSFLGLATLLILN